MRGDDVLQEWIAGHRIGESEEGRCHNSCASFVQLILIQHQVGEMQSSVEACQEGLSGMIQSGAQTRGGLGRVQEREDRKQMVTECWKVWVFKAWESCEQRWAALQLRVVSSRRYKAGPRLSCQHELTMMMMCQT
jgi:hypothetical protein